MKRAKTTLVIIVMFLSLCFSAYAQESKIDSTAIMILDRMADMIGELKSCGYTLHTSNDVIDVELGPVKYFNVHNVYMVGPDKMLVNTRGDKGHSGYWYNGKQLAYYSYTQNNYAIIDAPLNIIATIYMANKVYGIDFPAADFFYPSFTDDLIDQNDEIIYIGKSRVDDKDCFHILAKNENMSTQIWISDDALFLPVKLVIVYYDGTPHSQYEATFSDWKINPELPSVMFEFTPPDNANVLKLVAKQ